MFSRVSIIVCVCVFGAACLAWGEGTVYSGTFKADGGRKGPLSCELTPKEDGKWAVAFKAANEGRGPNRPLACNAEFTGKEKDDKLDLTGEVAMRRGPPYTVKAVLDGKSLKATFSKPEGKDAGSFDLTEGKPEEAKPAPAAEGN
jgi:hypothetical protein